MHTGETVESDGDVFGERILAGDADAAGWRRAVLGLIHDLTAAGRPALQPRRGGHAQGLLLPWRVHRVAGVGRPHPTTEADRLRGRAALGRPRRVSSRSCVRSADGSPLVIRNAPCSTTAHRCPPGTGWWGVRRTCGVSRLESAGGVARPRRRWTRRVAAAHAATRRRRRGAPAGHRGRGRPAGWAARRASSACTPTTPGTWPAGTIRSGAGSSTASAGPADGTAGSERTMT